MKKIKIKIVDIYFLKKTLNSIIDQVRKSINDDTNLREIFSSEVMEHIDKNVRESGITEDDAIHDIVNGLLIISYLRTANEDKEDECT